MSGLFDVLLSKIERYGAYNDAFRGFNDAREGLPRQGRSAAYLHGYDHGQATRAPLPVRG